MNRESGYTLLVTILTFTILFILGISIVTLTFASLKTSSKERDNHAVYYITEAGLNYQNNEFEKNANTIYKEVLNMSDNLLDGSSTDSLDERRKLTFLIN